MPCVQEKVKESLTLFFSQFCEKVFQECLPSASDESILEVRDALIDFLRNNMHKNSEACVAMLTGAKINYSRAFNNSQMAPLNNAMISVISSGHNKGRIPINTFMAEQDKELIKTLLFKEFGDDVLSLVRFLVMFLVLLVLVVPAVLS